MEDLAEIVCFFTGWLLLPVISLGRIKVAPLSGDWARTRRPDPPHPASDIVAGEGWCIVAGCLIWSAVFAVGVLLHHLRLI